MQDLKHQKRLQIIHSAVELFCVHGFAGTKIQDVAINADIGKSTVYEYFKSKEALFSECIKHMISYYNDNFSQIMDLDISFKDKLLKILIFTDEICEKASLGISALFQAPSKELVQMHEFIMCEKEYITKLLELSLIDAAKSGEIRSDIDINSIAMFIEICIMQMMSSKILQSDPKNIDDMLTLIFNGISNQNNFS